MVRQEGELTHLEADGRGIRGVVGHLRRWRQGGRIRELGAAIGARRTLLRRWRAELEARQLGERVQLGRRHAREIRNGGGDRRTLPEPAPHQGPRGEGRDSRTDARLAVRPSLDVSRLQVLVDTARLDQIREVEGEEAYRERFRRIEKLRKLGERVPPTRPTPQQSPRGQERGGGIER